MFAHLRGLTGARRRVLDLGAGEGALARPIAEWAELVDAVEISPAMVEVGRARPGGARSNLRWIVGPAETALVEGPYDLVTAGASLHWMRWEATLRLILRVSTRDAALAIVDQTYSVPWQAELVDVIGRYSRSRQYDPRFSLPDELDRRGLFEIAGRRDVESAPFTQPVSDYVEQFHSTASLARELMSPGEADRFDREVRGVVGAYADPDGRLPLTTVTSVAWGRPTVAGGAMR